MAGGSGLADTIDEGVGIAIHPDGLDGLDVSGGFAFLPESLAGARPVMRESTFLRFPEGGFVGVGELRAAFGLVSAVITGTESPCL